MTPKERLLIALQGGVPDRVPCSPHISRYARYHYNCACPLHQVQVGQEFGLDVIALYGHYICQSVTNDYLYSPGGGYNYNPLGLYGDLADVNVEMRIENKEQEVWYYRKFETPAGVLTDIIQWARPGGRYGDGPNPHRVEPLVKASDDLEKLKFLYPKPRQDVITDIPLAIASIGERGLLAACDGLHAGCWGMEVLGAEQMLMCSLTDPGLLQGVCQLANKAHLRNLAAMLENGIGIVFDSWFQCGPSVGWSPGTFQNIFLPLIEASVDLAHNYGAIYLYQDDGRQRDTIPFLVDAGVDVICGLQPPDIGDVVIREVKQQYGDKVALLGGLDPCYTFDMGNAETVHNATKQLIADAAQGGGLIVGTAEAIDPMTPPECLHAVSAATREFGTY